MKKLHLYILAILLGTVVQLSAQAPDPRFSQFYAAPLQLNPAMNGVFDGSWRAVVNYRDQWSSVLGQQSFKTLAASFDYRHNIVGDDYLAMGFDFLSDRAGVSKLTQTQGHLNVSYLKKVSGTGYSSQAQYLIAGTQVGIGQRSFDFSDLWFSSQFDGFKEEIDFSAASNETLTGSTNVYLNLNAGLMWYGIIGKNFSFYAGAAVNHANSPVITFLDDQTQNAERRWVGHAGAEIPFGDQLSILPAFMANIQGPSRSYTFGSNVRYSNDDWRELAIRVGFWGHVANELESSVLTDAVIFNLTLEFDAMQIGISYDINTSSFITASNSRGAYELSLLYSSPSRERRGKVKCPNF